MQEKLEMATKYEPQAVEARLYENWEKKGYFRANRKEGQKTFTIVMPPPNITGQLHMGHAMDSVPQDALTRYHRMKGEAALWLPGTDHASIATEVKIVEKMKEEGLSKADLGREGFLERAWQWKNEYGGRIVAQLRKLGASCDWSRERFTMDEGCSKAVTEVFVNLYNEGLIYRGERIINWCPVCKTALSDAEVEYEEHASHFWHIAYEAEDGTRIVVATTRPETMLGDTAVAVHPEDERYAHLIGKTVMLPLQNRPIPIVADDYVDKEFGTGAVKITPAHDPNDFELGLRHNLPIMRVMEDDGTMSANAGVYAGLSREACRKKVVADLEAIGALVKVEDHNHNVGACYRCDAVVEPLVSKQWFVRMKPLAEPALDVVREGKTRFVPERFDKTYFNWMENIRDWCISRQLWWGHRIPAWYCGACGKEIVAKDAPETCPDCGGAMHQDEDVLDTWFSSALWPFSTLGWPEKTQDLADYYPNNVLVTGYDIIFFWVARMIFSGIHHMGETPFSTVLIHGLVRDSQGRKMSKSLGNGVDPLEIIEQYGADALRFSLTIGVSPGNDLRYGPEKVEAARNFCNKLWNASRFVRMNLDADIAPIRPEFLDAADKWILTRYQELIAEVTRHLDGFDLGLAAQKLYDFTWSTFCDWYIELAKSRLLGDNLDLKQNVQAVLYTVMEGILKLLHPFMPFITEEIYLNLPKSGETILYAPWPVVDAALTFEADAEKMEGVMEAIRAVRNLRSQMNVPPSRKARLLVKAKEGWGETLLSAEGYFARLAWAAGVELVEDVPEKTAAALCPAAEIYIPLGELVDVQKELARLAKEEESLMREHEKTRAKLSNDSFTQKAPPAVVEEERKRLMTQQGMLEAVKGRIEQMKALEEARQ